MLLLYFPLQPYLSHQTSCVSHLSLMAKENKKALFHKNPKEKYKPQNQTMTDDSDDTHPNLF